MPAVPSNGTPTQKKKPKTYDSAEAAIQAILTWPKVRGGCHVGTWDYHKTDGSLSFRVARFDLGDGSKVFRPISPEGKRWVVRDPPGKLPLYGLPELTGATRCIVVEGEKCVDAATLIGLVATTSAHGATSAHKTNWTPLAGKDVVILPDVGKSGEEYAQSVARILWKLNARVRVLRLPGLENDGDDIVQWIAAQRDDVDVAGLIDELAEAAPLWQPAEAAGDAVREPLPWVPFPVDALPDPLRRFVVEGSAALGCDPVFLAMPAMAVVASSIGTSRRILLKDTWCEPSILWSAVVADSGTLKTPPFDLALEPLHARQSEALHEHDQAIEAYERDLVRYGSELRDWTTTGRKKDLPMPTKPVEPNARRSWANDITIESLATILDKNPRGVLLARDELSGWLGSFDQYRAGKGADVAHWLEMHRGGRLLVDRKTGTKRTIHVARASVGVAGTIQIRTLQRALGREHFENGLCARLLLAMPPRREKRWSERTLSASTRNEYAGLIATLFSLGHGKDESGHPVPIDVPLSRLGKVAWIAFYNDFAKEQASATGDLAAAFSKLEGYAARFALIVHFIRWACDDSNCGDEIDEKNITAGVTLARWFARETDRIYGALQETQEDSDIRRLVEFIEAREGAVSVRDVRLGCRWIDSSDEARARLQRLVDAGRGRLERPKPGPKGGRPTELFYLNHQPSVCDTHAHGSARGGFVDVDAVGSLENTTIGGQS